MAKSKYKGVHQRKSGKWYYRIKKTYEDGSVKYFQDSGFNTEEDAHKARIQRLRAEAYRHGYAFEPDLLESGEYKTAPLFDPLSFADTEYDHKTFFEVFKEFLSSGYVESETSKKKYQDLYNAQLYVWADKEIHTFKDTDIDLFMLRLSLRGYKASYQASIRKLIKKVFDYANLVDPIVPGDIAIGIDTKPYKLRVLSLFSGIGAPEQALKELGIDYELVNFCEIDKNAAEAYCLLHGATPDQNLGDIVEVAYKVMEPEVDRLEKQVYGVEPEDTDYFTIPDYDIMFFGFPCTDISKSGKQKGLSGKHSRLFFDAMRIARMTRPKLMIAENVSALVSNQFRSDYHRIIDEFRDCGYQFYTRKVNANKFGLPQNRDRVFMVLVREDLEIDYKFPNGFPLEIKAEDWFEPVVDEEYYASESQLETIRNTKSRKPNYKRDCISCITTGWGTPSYTQQTFVEDEKGVRCLSSEELMRFQGFSPEQGTMLRKAGFSKNQVGHMVGNSIAVPAIKAVLENLFSQLCKEKQPVRYNFITDTTEKVESPYIQPLFAYMGNKSKLLNYLKPLMPKGLENMNFVDLFTGAGTVAINVDAKRILMNDISKFMIGIYEGLSATPPKQGWAKICQIVDKYHLDEDSPEYYDQCRIEYNIRHAYYAYDYWYWGLALVYHSFNRSTVSHNKAGDLNSAYGYKKCDMGVAQRRFFPFAEKMYLGNYELSCKDFRKAIPEDMKPEETFVYVDPPYWITSAGYNKIWHEEDEVALYQYLDDLHKRGYRWMLSNVTENKQEKNHILIAWLKEHEGEYHVEILPRSYNNCTANSKNIGTTVEVLVTNYKE